MKAVLFVLAIVAFAYVGHGFVQVLLSGTGPNCPNMDQQWLGICK